ncbi:DUF4328 domain-containing protein [Lentzea nigeriaca]|uniref:DUF4328 domain-containing protein n=1 Tax=Lentzea nigeriaca TaxID=1128665 RepID=UPI0019581059|nr:DUF4328 domain-containing protein [Lentzea nigeriaca]MBM7864840.1 hypothetical protein [Lentzea nigeriaca]
MEHFQPVHGLARAASILVGVVAVGNVANAASDWFTYATIRDYRDRVVPVADLRTADKISLLTGTSVTLLTLVAGIVFMMWTYNARINAERLTYANEHRQSRVWVWLGWLVPVVNLWFPKQIIDDIWRASDPRQQGVPLQQRVKARLTTQWWIAFVLMWLFDRAYVRTYINGEMTTDSFLNAAVFSTIAAVTGIVAAVCAVQVVQRISGFQHSPVPLQSSSD